MKKQVMKKAWEIRKEAASKWNCQVSEIHFGACLSLAWKESFMKQIQSVGGGIFPDYVLYGWKISGESEKAFQFSRTRGPIRPVWIPKKAVEGQFKDGYKIATWYAEKNDMKGLKRYPGKSFEII